MNLIGRGQAVYFVAVGLLALWVGVWGFFLPSRVDVALPWSVPPLHARFLGAMYLSGAAAMLLSLFANRWAQVRVILPMIAIWTGMLFLISLLHLTEFDFTRTPVWVWFGAYLIFPLIALWLLWQNRSSDRDPLGPPLPGWASSYLLVQGIVASFVGLALLFFPGVLAVAWPWPVTMLLAQLYAAPLLSYGVGSLMLARGQTWPQARIAMAAILVFSGFALAASIIHLKLFTPGLSAWVWFGSFAFATVMLGLLTLRAFAYARPDASS